MLVVLTLLEEVDFFVEDGAAALVAADVELACAPPNGSTLGMDLAPGFTRTAAARASTPTAS